MSEPNFTETHINISDVTSYGTSSTPTDTSDKIDIMMVVHSLIGCVGILGNITVIIVFLNHKKFRQKIPNMFIINQSFLDFVASVVLLLSTLTVRDHYAASENKTLGWIQCHLWNSKFLLWGLFGSSTWNIVSLTFERYLELVHTMWHKVHFKKRWIDIGFAINCTVGLAFNAGYLIPTTKIVSGTCIISDFWPSDHFAYVFAFCLFGLEYLFPLLILFYCYGRIVWVLSRRIYSNLGNTAPAPKRNTSNSKDTTDTFQLARTNTIKTFVLVGVCFIICLSNAHIYYFMYNLGYELNYNGTYYQFTVLMVFLNCTVNPFIYLVKYKDYQDALKQFFGCGQRKRKSNAESEISEPKQSTSTLTTSTTSM